MDEPLYLYFRGTNYTHDEGVLNDPQCQIMFIEIEFRSKDTLHACDENLTPVKAREKFIEITEDYLDSSRE
jgi:hypothetical protein